MSLCISNIQRMSLDDGPGIRTTIFFQGCNLFCPWCTNPETQPVKQTSLFCSKEYEIDRLIAELLKDKAYWSKEGGVTLSGGEPLLQADQLYELCVKLKREEVHIAIETSLSVDSNKVERLIDLIDYWYIDIKILDENQAKRIIGLDAKKYISNVEICNERGCDIHFRIPCSKEWTFEINNWEAIRGFLRNYRKYPVELFAIHDLAKNKYDSLGKEMAVFRKLSQKELFEKKKELDELGISATIITL